MARLSRLVSLGNKSEVDIKLSTCFFCSKTINEGGCWAGEYEIGVCKKCSHYLVELLLDTMYDTDEKFRKSSLEDKNKYLENMFKSIVMKKEKRRVEMDKYESIKKLGLKYYSEIGIIDFFDGTMTAKQFVNTLDEESQYKRENILECEEEIKTYIEEKTGERPHTVRFFVIPDNSYGMFSIACVAKISNNGSTFIFCNNRDYFEVIDNAGYRPSVELTY